MRMSRPDGMAWGTCMDCQCYYKPGIDGDESCPRCGANYIQYDVEEEVTPSES